MGHATRCTGRHADERLQSATEFASFDTSKNSFLLSPDVLAGPCQGDERIGVFQSSVPGLGPAAFCYWAKNHF